MKEEEKCHRNQEADVLIRDNMRLVLKIANDFLGRGLPWDDLVSEGNRGLVIAAHRFNPDLGAKFSTYSAWWIKQAIRQALAEQTQTIRVPVGTQLNSRRIKRSVRKLKLELDREPTNEEVAADAQVSLVTVARLRDTRQVDMQSLNEMIGSDDSDGVELQDYEKLERLNDRLADSQNIQNKEQFKYGFAMGVLLMKEVYEHPEFKPKE